MSRFVRLGLCAIAAAVAIQAGRLAAAPAAPSGRVVAVGDIHGDVDACVAILQRAGVLDDKLKWAAGAATLVQVGDMIDRGAEARPVMDLLMRLQREAPRQADASSC